MPTILSIERTINPEVIERDIIVTIFPKLENQNFTYDKDTGEISLNNLEGNPDTKLALTLWLYRLNF